MRQQNPSSNTGQPAVHRRAVNGSAHSGPAGERKHAREMTTRHSRRALVIGFNILFKSINYNNYLKYFIDYAPSWQAYMNSGSPATSRHARKFRHGHGQTCGRAPETSTSRLRAAATPDGGAALHSLTALGYSHLVAPRWRTFRKRRKAGTAGMQCPGLARTRVAPAGPNHRFTGNHGAAVRNGPDGEGAD